MTDRRFSIDASVQRHGLVLIGGSPLRLFRLTPAGGDVVDRIEAGTAVGPSRLVDALLDAGAIHPVVSAPARYGADDVTIVVPTLGPPEHVPAGAVVVDDGSDPPVVGAAVRLDRNLGPGAARNAGLERVTTPLVAFVDGDVELPAGWLDALLPHFDDERVGLVAPRVATANDGSALARYEARHSPLDLGTEPGRVRPGSRVSYVPAAAVVCRTAAVRGLNGFDAGLRFGEDVDFVWRLVDAGWRARYEPASVVHHAPRRDWWSWWRQRVGYGSSTAPLARRHPGALAPLRMSGWSLGSWALGVLGRPVAGAAVGVGSAAALVRRLPDVPAGAAFRIAAIGNVRAGDQIARAIRRTWWPILAVLALRSRAARRALFAAALASRHPVALIDDCASSIGVWKGIVSERTIDPLVPEITSWPGRSAGPNRYRPPS